MRPEVYPAVVVIDAKGTIRQIGALGTALDKIVADLLEEMEAKTPAR